MTPHRLGGLDAENLPPPGIEVKNHLFVGWWAMHGLCVCVCVRVRAPVFEDDVTPEYFQVSLGENNGRTQDPFFWS